MCDVYNYFLRFLVITQVEANDLIKLLCLFHLLCVLLYYTFALLIVPK